MVCWPRYLRLICSAMAWPAGGLAELRWYALVALFVAALATLAVYLVQYALLALRRRRGKRRPPRQPPAAPRDELLEDGGSALAWALSLGSWRRQWRRAWVAALRGEAAARAVSAGLQVRREGGVGQRGTWERAVGGVPLPLGASVRGERCACLSRSDRAGSPEGKAGAGERAGQRVCERRAAQRGPQPTLAAGGRPVSQCERWLGTRPAAAAPRRELTAWHRAPLEAA